MDDPTRLTRRGWIAGAAGLTALSALPATAAPPVAAGRIGDLADLDPIRTELVMNLVVTCSSPESMGASGTSKDGMRNEIWPIVGGRFEGPRLRGSVVPGGGDFPVTRPDGIEVVDAFYRLKTDDGVTIIIHNKGFGYPPDAGHPWRYRLIPEFTAPGGRYDWLNKSIFLATLLDPPAAMTLARNKDENDRLIQVHRIV